MKKTKVSVIMGMLLMSLLTVVLLCTSCENNYDPKDHSRPEYVDTVSTEYANDVLKGTNQYEISFSDVNSFVNYAEKQVFYQEYINTISKLDQRTLELVATSCINKHKTITPKLFIQEYTDNKCIYEAASEIEKKRAKQAMRNDIWLESHDTTTTN